MVNHKQELLQQIPSITELLKFPKVQQWIEKHSATLVTDCLRESVGHLRQQVLSDTQGACGSEHVRCDAILDQAAERLRQRTTPHIRRAINATGIILHTGLGRAVLSPAVVNSMVPELTGYCTLAVDITTGERAERDELVEYILTELTGAEAATVVNNNAAATMLVLAALAGQKEVIVSRGQLIEIGGSFRLPEVMAESQARLVEVGATNRTHLKDYRNAITADTAAIMRVHPSNYRVVGFTSEVAGRELSELAHSRNLLFVDDLGAGALVGLEQFGLPHEPTVCESIEAGADLVLFSGDKLIGGSQAGIIVGRRELVEKLRKHPLMRAMRADKTCLMILERTLHLFRNPQRLAADNPTYVMLAAPLDAVRSRANTLVETLGRIAPQVRTQSSDSAAYLGSGSLPNEAIPSIAVAVKAKGLSASEWARSLRMDDACVFARIEHDLLWLDMRTVTDQQIPALAEAVARVAAQTR